MEKENFNYESIRDNVASFVWGMAFGNALASAMFLWLIWRDKKEREEN